MPRPKGPQKEQVLLRLLKSPTMAVLRKIASDRNQTVPALLSEAIEAKYGKNGTDENDSL